MAWIDAPRMNQRDINRFWRRTQVSSGVERGEEYRADVASGDTYEPGMLWPAAIGLATTIKRCVLLV